MLVPDRPADQEHHDVIDLEPTFKTRRDVLGLLGGLGAAALVAGCGSSGTKRASTKNSSTTASTNTAASTNAAAASCTPIPTETAGPFPGDGTNGRNVLTQDGIVRSDIRSSFGAASGVATGLPLMINLTILDNAHGCMPLTGAAVYLWHCNIDGLYSMYSNGVTEENYLRGVQKTDANGRVTFRSIFPGAYPGRWPHIHFEMFPSLAQATNGSDTIAVSQLAFPGDVCRAVYATNGYSQSMRNLAQISIERDMVFSDGVSLQTPTMTGGASNGYTASLPVGVG